MIFLFAGDDTKNKHFAYEKFVKSMPVGTESFLVSRNDFDTVQVEIFYSGSSLFSEKSAMIFQNIFAYEETRNFILDKLKLMEESANFFIFLEGKLNKPILDAFKKALPADRQVVPAMNIFELPKKRKRNTIIF